MTRFWISLQQGVELVIKALEESKGGETFISKIPSFKITDLAQAMLPGCEMPEVGIREGEKLHEIMVTVEDSLNTYEYDKHFIYILRWYGANLDVQYLPAREYPKASPTVPVTIPSG